VAAEAASTGLPVVLTDRTGPLDYGKRENSVRTSPFEIEPAMREMIEKLEFFDTVEVRNSITQLYGSENFSKRLEFIFGTCIKSRE
jgi:glycosyltransferase involved in cell wall biosynthesis